MSTKAQKVNTRLVLLGCLLVTLFLSIPATPRIAAQRNVAENLPDGGCFGSAATEPPLGIGSQQFAPAPSGVDSQAADDFIITQGLGATYIIGVRVRGEHSAGGGPALRFNIYFYSNGTGNLPGHWSRRSSTYVTSKRRLIS